MIIVFEGIDGCGKTTLAEIVREALEVEGRPFNCPAEVLHFPVDDTVTGPVIREYLAGKHRSHDSPYANALMFQALQLINRVELQDRLRAASSDQINLVLSRYWQSGVVYGGFDGLRDTEWMIDVSLKIMEPAAVNILIDVPAEVAYERIVARNKAKESYERLEFMGRLRDAYLELWDSYIRVRKPVEGWFVLDGTLPVADLRAQLLDELCHA